MKPRNEQSTAARPGSNGIRVIAFGDPQDPRTFSGYARSLTRAIDAEGRLAGGVSCRNLRHVDVLHGAVDFRPLLRLRRPRISRSWLWQERASRGLSERLDAILSDLPPAGSLLQVGTLVRPNERFGPHDVVTDMTIPQAAEAGFFDVAHLAPRRLEEATRVQAAVLRHARHVFTLSRWAADSVVKDFGVPVDRVTPIYAGPNLEVSARPEDVRRTRSLVFIGIDWIRKGGPEMLAGFALARRRVPDAGLTVIGCDPAVDAPGVRVLGYLPPDNPDNRATLSRALLSSRALCLLSSFDPFPNVIVEAYAHSLPVIAFDSGSRREIVEHEASGLLIPDRNPEAIADAMVRVLTDDAWFHRASARANELHRNRFQWACVVRTILDAIDRPTGSPVYPSEHTS